MKSEHEELIKKLGKEIMCAEGCEGRCRVCPVELAEDATAAIRELSAEVERLQTDFAIMAGRADNEERAMERAEKAEAELAKVKAQFEVLDRAEKIKGYSAPSSNYPRDRAAVDSARDK